MDAVEPGMLVRAALARERFPFRSPSVVAAGKAALPMYRAAAAALTFREAVVTAAHADAASGLTTYAAGHPAPNAASVAAAEHALVVARAADGLLVLLSGGASAMLAAPARGLSLDDKVATSRALMRAGAPIDELNCVRKHLSRIKGGRLGAAAGGRTLTLALSDVHGPVADDPSVIGSGPTVADPTTFRDALGILSRRGVDAAAPARTHLVRGADGAEEETIKPGDPVLSGARYAVVGHRHTAVAGARDAAVRLGYRVEEVHEASAGEAREAAVRFVSAARGASGPLCLLGSGEPTVTVRGDGVGGRNLEFALAAASALTAFDRRWAVASAGTDGIDGPTDAAGAVADPTTTARARAAGLDPDGALARNDTYPFFDALGDVIRWGPTGTNVGDVHVLLID